MNEYCIDVSLRFVAYVPDGTDASKWVEEHKDEIIGTMRSKLDSGNVKIVFEENWGDIIDYGIYCD